MKGEQVKKGEMFWPQVNGVDVSAVTDPITGLPMCQDCWNGMHKREGCRKPSCMCGCYHGRNKELGKPQRPARDSKEQEKLPDVGTFTV
jgi:hypothetical protein